MASWKWTLALLAAMACGGAAKSTTTPGGDGATKDCEPGRCLDDIAKKIQERKPEARACYDALNTSKQKGRLVINFRIDAEGNVTETSQGMQEDQIQDETLVTCVSDVIKSVKFEKSAAGKATRAYHQFEFAPRNN
jgi:hypothetical protein